MAWFHLFSCFPACLPAFLPVTAAAAASSPCCPSPLPLLVVALLSLPTAASGLAVRGVPVWPYSARISGESARVPASRSLLQAHYDRKCAHRGTVICFARAFRAIMRAFRPRTPSSARDLGKSALAHVLCAAIRERFSQKCAQIGCLKGTRECFRGKQSR